MKKVLTFVMIIAMVSMFPTYGKAASNDDLGTVICDMVTEVSEVVMDGLMSGVTPREIIISCFSGATSEDVRLACSMMTVDAITYVPKGTPDETIKAFTKEKREECFHKLDIIEGNKTSL